MSIDVQRVMRYYPDPVLRQVCNPVERFEDALGLIARLSETLAAHDNGAALAAPQIGVLQRVLVYRDEGIPKALVNPIVSEHAGALIDEEGCLSIPGLYLPVERAQRVRVTGLNEVGEAVDFAAEDFLARVVQHETDHLDGILFLQRLTPENRKKAMKWLRS